MVDCFDRIAVQMTEIVLEPILLLAERPTMAAVTVRLPSSGRSVLLTVSKQYPHGESNAPVYVWTLERSDASGRPAGVIADDPATGYYPRPEDAFWGAVGAVRDAHLAWSIVHADRAG